MSNKKRISEAYNKLREYLKAGDKVGTILAHVSKSGMTRHIKTVIVKEGQTEDITPTVAAALGYKVAASGGMVVTGCGMDMGFAVVYDLGRGLWTDGTDKAHGTRNGVADFSGGYALKQYWI